MASNEKTIKRKFAKSFKSQVLKRLRNDPVFFAKVIMNFTPYKYQNDLLNCKSKRIVAVWGRQSGKTTCIALKVIHFAYTHKGVIVIIVSKGLRQSMIMFGAVSHFVLGNDILRKSIVRYTRTQIRLKNGSQILALPCSSDGANLRGHTADMVIMDEAAFMPETVISQVIFPMLATTNGTSIMLSTPWGRNHIFYRSYSNPNFWVQRVMSKDCPRITQEFLDEQRNLIGKLRYEIEYEAKFLEDQNALFTQDMIRGCIEIYGEQGMLTDKDLEKLTTKLADKFFIGVDLGKRFDHSVIVVLKYQPLRMLDDEGTEMIVAPAFKLVYIKEFELKTKLSTVMKHIGWLTTRFNIVKGCIDETGIGQAVVEKIGERYPQFEGVWFTAQSKQELAMYLYTRMEQRRLAIPHNQELIAQLNEQKYYYGRAKERVDTVEKGVMLFEHPEGRHDDQLWALALAMFSTKHKTKRRGLVIS